jgi:hypothetical protein
MPSRLATTDRFAAAQAVGDAVLFEGYLLYPYRRSAAKNRIRWQFGVLTPRPWIDAQQIPDPGVAGAAESWFQHVECLAEAPSHTNLRVRVRFLHLLRRQIYDPAGEPVDSAPVGADTVLSFDEGVPREIDAEFPLAELRAGEQCKRIELPGGTNTEQLGAGAGRMEGTWRPLQVMLRAAAEPAGTPFPLLRLRLRVENAAETGADAERDAILHESLLATHVLAGLDDGRFVSLLDPPAWAAEAARACASRHVFPVLAGADNAADKGADVLLCSPIILYDHPQIAPESPGALHDAAEIDEILSLRTLTLTDDEKREARATDPRAAAIVERVDTMPPELLARLHGAVRELRPAARTEDELPWWDPRADAAVDPESDSVMVAGRRIGRGSRVRLRPRGRGADAHDMFLAGRIATVHAVLRDVDGSLRLAVTVDGDPAAELHEWYGRFFHFAPEEIEPIGPVP